MRKIILGVILLLFSWQQVVWSNQTENYTPGVYDGLRPLAAGEAAEGRQKLDVPPLKNGTSAVTDMPAAPDFAQLNKQLWHEDYGIRPGISIDSIISGWQMEKLKRLLEELRPEQLDRISKGDMLLVGPGTPEEVLILSEAFPNLRSLTVVDYHPNVIRAVQVYLENGVFPHLSPGRVRLIESDFTKVEGDFDLAYCNNLICDIISKQNFKWAWKMKDLLKRREGVYMTWLSFAEHFFLANEFTVRVPNPNDRHSRHAFIACINPNVFQPTATYEIKPQPFDWRNTRLAFVPYDFWERYWANNTSAFLPSAVAYVTPANAVMRQQVETASSILRPRAAGEKNVGAVRDRALLICHK